jgi:hypothetical protein
LKRNSESHEKIRKTKGLQRISEIGKYCKGKHRLAKKAKEKKSKSD